MEKKLMQISFIPTQSNNRRGFDDAFGKNVSVNLFAFNLDSNFASTFPAEED